MNIVTPSVRVVGSLDSRVGRFLYGWIFYPDLPDDPVTINICIDGEVAGTAVADQYREDLEYAGKGNGYHAFKVELPPHVFDNEPHTIAVQDSVSGVFLLPQFEDVRLDSRDRSDFRGDVVGLRGSDLIGYAYDQRSLDVPVSVALFLDGQEFATAVADQVTPVDSSSGEVPPCCGFALPIDHVDPNRLLSGKAKVVALPDFSMVGAYSTFASDFAQLAVRKSGQGLIATINLAFVPSQLVSFDLFVNNELYATIDADPEAGHASYSIPIVTHDPGVATYRISATYCGTGVEIGNSPQTTQQRLNLIENSRFEKWSGAVPVGWEIDLPAGVSAVRAFGDASADSSVAGNKLVLECGEGTPSLGGARLSQTIDVALEDATQLDVFLEGKSDGRADVKISATWQNDDGSEAVVEKCIALWPSWGILAARFEIAPPDAAPVTVAITVGADEATKRIEIGRVAAGLPGFKAQPGQSGEARPLRDRGVPNVVNNGTFEVWRDAVRRKVSLRRMPIADNWMLTCKERCPDLEARLVEVVMSDPTGGVSARPGYGLALYGPVVGKNLRLQTELNKAGLADLGRGKFSFDVRKASGLSINHDDRKTALSRIAEIFIAERQFFDSSESFDDTKLFTLKSRLDVPLRAERVEVLLSPEQCESLRVSANRMLYDLNRQLVLVFEVSDFADCVVTDVVLGEVAEGAEVPPTSGYVSIEDPNIAAQLQFLKGLDRWRGYERLYPPKSDKIRPVSTAGPVWAWSADAGRSVDIVVCVHDAIEESLACLESIRLGTEIPHTVTIVDDASAGSAREQLRQFAAGLPWVRVIELDENLGYTKSANAGLMSSRADWVVLLNSDTIVSPGWLAGLFEVVSAKPDVALVGPVSNAASWQSVPDLNDVNGKWKVNPLPEGMSVAGMAELVSSIALRGFPEVPLLNGFCTLMKRKVLEEVGFLDEVAFPIGYGEENDLCVRVGKAGYKLAVADHVYVYHVKSATFGAKRGDLAKKGAASFAAKHPDIDLNQLQQVLAESTPLIELRKALRLHIEERWSRPAAGEVRT